MFIEPNFSPTPGSEYAADYDSLLQHYSTGFGVPFERPSATYWPHTLVPSHFHLKLLDMLCFSTPPAIKFTPSQLEALSEVSPIAINLAVGGAASAYWPTMVMVQMSYPNRSNEELLDIAHQLRETNASAELFGGNQLAQAMTLWGQKIARAPQDLTRQDFEHICATELPVELVVNLTQRASVQSHFAMGCSSGGADDLPSAMVPLKQLVSFEAFANSAPDNLTARPVTSDNAASTQQSRQHYEPEQTSWVPLPDLPEDDAVYEPVKSALGWIPNLFKAVAHSPEYITRHLHALHILDKPQTNELTPKHHTMARLLVCRILDSAYFLPTANAYLERVSDDAELSDAVMNWTSGSDRRNESDKDRTVLELGQKIVCNAYKITQQDVHAVCKIMGWSDAGYADFMNTVAIQDSLCRLAHALGVTPDDRPLLET